PSVRRGRRGRLREEPGVLAVTFGLEAVCGDEAQRRRVDAVAQAGRSRAVVEDVPEVRIAGAGPDLDTAHVVRGVALGRHVRLVDRLLEARPAGFRVELVERAEERLAGRDVDEDAGLVVVPVLVVIAPA